MSDQEAEAQSSTPTLTPVAQIPVNLPLPAQLSLTGNLTTNWKRFQRAWKNYEIAARLKDPGNSIELQRFSPVLAWMHWMFTTPLFLKLQSRDIDIVLKKIALARLVKRMNVTVSTSVIKKSMRQSMHMLHHYAF